MKNRKYLIGIFIVFVLFSFGSIVSGAIPELSNENPSTDSTNIDIRESTVNVTIYDLETTFNWTIQGTYVTNAGANGASNGSKSANLITPLPFSTNIVWYVNVTDGTDWTNATYNFTTRSESRLTEHFTDPVKLVLIGLISLFLILGLVMYCIKTFKDNTFKLETFFKLFFAVVVIIVVMSFI